jgi:membrane-associated phospholipid phosphatase
MAFARVFVGAHYPGDVVGGAVLGGATSVALGILSEKTSVRRGLERIFRMLSRWHLAASGSGSPSKPADPK